MTENVPPQVSILKRRGGIWTVIAVLLVAGIITLMVFNSQRRPDDSGGNNKTPANLIVISIDTLRADHLGCYGHKAARTPVIDKLAQEGTLFEKHYTCYPLTLPAHLTQLTGVSTLGHRVRDNLHHRLPDQIGTLAESLGKRGFTCGAFVSAYTMKSGSGIERGFSVYDDEGIAAVAPGRMTVPERKAEATLRKASDWLKSAAKSGSRVFCFIHLFDPHAPYDPPADLKQQFSGEHGLYDAEIAYTDRCLGEFFETLRPLGLLDSAVVAITADHGEGLGQHDELSHGFFCYDTTTHVPLILHGVPGARAGGRPKAVTRNYDLTPTLVDALAIDDKPFAKQFHGQSLAPLCRDPSGDPGLAAYIESHYGYLTTGWAKIRALRTRESLTLFSGSTAERYHDMLQLSNVAGEHPDEVAAARTEIARLIGALMPPLRGKTRRGGADALGTPYPGESPSVQNFDIEAISDTKDLKTPMSQAQILLEYQQAELIYDQQQYLVCADRLRKLAGSELVPAHKLLATVNQMVVTNPATRPSPATCKTLIREAYDSLALAGSICDRIDNEDAAQQVRANAALLALWLGDQKLFRAMAGRGGARDLPQVKWLEIVARYQASPNANAATEAEEFLAANALSPALAKDAQATLAVMKRGEKLKLAPWD